jgi:hypothetical protein
MAIDFKPLTITPVNFSLTDGTPIPAPLDSPPRTPIDGHSSNTENAVRDASQRKTAANGATATPDSKRAPLSPTSATSQGSQQQKKVSGVRKFFSLRSSRGEGAPKKLHKQSTHPITSPAPKLSYDNSRPGSPLSTVEPAPSSEGDDSQNTLKHKRSTGWFNSASGRRKSNMYVVGRLDERIAGASEKKSGPPPPAIPELDSFAVGMDGGEIGGEELFKDIGKDIKVDDLDKSQKTGKSTKADNTAALTGVEKPEETPPTLPIEQSKVEATKQSPETKPPSSTAELSKPTAVAGKAEAQPSEVKSKEAMETAEEPSNVKPTDAQTVENEAPVESNYTEKVEEHLDTEPKAPVVKNQERVAEASKISDETKEHAEPTNSVEAPTEAIVEPPNAVAEAPAATSSIENPTTEQHNELANASEPQKTAQVKIPEEPKEVANSSAPASNNEEELKQQKEEQS